MNLRFYGLALLLFVFAAGCSTPPPPVIPVGGVLTIEGKPLPNAEIKFVPMQEDLDGNFTASGVTDKNGKFKLKLPGKTESGCCACECKVLVVEGPMPDGARRDNNAGFAAAASYKNSLKDKGRPIPAKYERVGTTPLTMTISEGEGDLKIDLVR